MLERKILRRSREMLECGLREILERDVREVNTKRRRTGFYCISKRTIFFYLERDVNEECWRGRKRLVEKEEGQRRLIDSPFYSF